MKYTFDALNVYLGTIKVLYNRRRLTKHCRTVEKSKNRRRFCQMCRFQHIMCRQLSQWKHLHHCTLASIFKTYMLQASHTPTSTSAFIIRSVQLVQAIDQHTYRWWYSELLHREGSIGFSHRQSLDAVGVHPTPHSDLPRTTQYPARLLASMPWLPTCFDRVIAAFRGSRYQ